MKERLVRLAKWNQRVIGALLLALAYLAGIGPASVFLRIGRFFGFGREAGGGWRPLARREWALDDLKEQS
jgi:hypothetical protein